MTEQYERPVWSPRVGRQEIARLYHADAKGIRDEELVNEIGLAFFARIEDTLTVTDAHRGRVKCVRCGTVIVRNPPRLRKDADKEMIVCACGWRLPWVEYFRSYHKKRLLVGGLEPFFREFVAQWPRARGYGEKMVLLDTLIHRFHWELQGEPGGPGAANLIGGTRAEIIAFLNELTHGDQSTPTLAANREQWRKKLGWSDWSEANVDERARQHRWEGFDSLGNQENQK